MNEYQAFYEGRFARNLSRYSNIRQRIKRRVEQILKNPYDRTERLGQVSGGLDLRGCRSARVDRNFRLIFVIIDLLSPPLKTNSPKAFQGDRPR